MVIKRGGSIPVLSVALTVLVASVAHAAPTAITYASWYQNPEDIRLIKRFNELNPDVKVTMTVITPDSSARNWMRGVVEKLVVAAIGGKSPDVLRINHETVVPLANAGLFADLGPFVKRSRFNLGNYFAPNVDLYKVKGKQVGIPLSINNYAVFHNRRMLAEAGVAELNTLAAQDGWDRDAFLQVARKTTRDTNGDKRIDVYGVDDVPAWVGRDVYISQSGGTFFTPDGRKAALNSPEAVDGLRFMADMKFVHKVWKPEGWGTGLWEKRAAMMICSGWVINKCLDARIDFDTAPVFQGKAQKWFPAAGDGIAIGSSGKHKEAAWRFARFMAGHEAQSLQAKAGIIAPALIPVAMGEAFAKSEKQPRNREAFLKSMPNTLVVEPRFIKNEQSVADLITKMYDDLWSGRKSPNKVAEEFTNAANRLL